MVKPTDIAGNTEEDEEQKWEPTAEDYFMHLRKNNNLQY